LLHSSQHPELNLLRRKVMSAPLSGC